jgi:hypothetical protein
MGKLRNFNIKKQQQINTRDLSSGKKCKIPHFYVDAWNLCNRILWYAESDDVILVKTIRLFGDVLFPTFYKIRQIFSDS